MMHFITPLVFAGFAVGIVVPRAFGVPNNDGFPNPSAAQLAGIASQAGGQAPYGPLPSSLDADSTTAWQLIVTNELFESAYFANLVSNITNGVTGYEGDGRLVATINAVLAQEELHALAATQVLKAAGAFAPGPCQYTFPVATLPDALVFAQAFTSAVLGALQGAGAIFAKGGLAPLVQILGSVIGQEGEQNGYYRFANGQIPSEAPFLTYVQAPFAWSVLQSVIVPGSCPFDLNQVALPIFPPLVANGQTPAILEAREQTISFTADLTNSDKAKSYVGGDGSGLYVTYTVAQLLPLSVPVSDVKWSGDSISLIADFPYSQFLSRGFSHAALTTSNSFETADDVVDCTLAAPALLEVAFPL